MRNFVLILFSVICLSFVQEDFKSLQMKNKRVKEAYVQKEQGMKDLYKQKGISFSKQEILLRIFKYEKKFELWARTKGQQNLLLVKEYDICNVSGGLGPKRKEGDLQTPEGFYQVRDFNPNSSYHLSLGLNYPNASDKILSDKTSPGGEIYIHGKCVTIGCVPMTDEKINEIYIAAVEARNSGQQKIPVYVFPCKMHSENILQLKQAYANKDLHAFWDNLKTGYDLFEKNPSVLNFKVDEKGQYVF